MTLLAAGGLLITASSQTLGMMILGTALTGLFSVVAIVVLAAFIYLLVRPNKYAGNNEVKIDVTKI